MNVERLHQIADAVFKELQAPNLENLLQQITTHLQNQISQPNQPKHQEELSKILAQVYEALDKASSNDFPPTWNQVIDEIGGDGLLGQKLKNTIEEIFSRNQITLTVALDEIQKIHGQVQKFHQGVAQTTTGLSNLNIGADELEPGECEVGIIIPRACVKNQLDIFGKEILNINNILGVFAEVATGSRPSFEIRVLSSSELTIFLDAVSPTAACIAFAAERMVKFYKSLLEVRKLRKELEEKGVSEDNLKGINKHADETMKKGIEETIDELLQNFYTREDGGRRNELKIELRGALNKIANRIDKGYNIEVRIEPIGKAQEDDSEENLQQKNKHIEIIESAKKELQFFKQEGKPILSLPEPDGENKEEKEGEIKEKKQKQKK